MTSIEYLDEHQGWARFDTKTIQNFKVGESLYLRLGVSTDKEVPIGFNVEFAGTPDNSIKDAWGWVKSIFNKASIGTSMLELKAPAFETPGQGRVVMHGSSMTMGTPSPIQVGLIAGGFVLEKIINIKNRAANGSEAPADLPALPPKKPHTVIVKVEGIDEKLTSSVLIVVNNNTPEPEEVTVLPGQTQLLSVPITAKVSVSAQPSTDEEFKGWSYVSLPEGAPGCALNDPAITSCLLFNGYATDSVAGAQIVAKFAKKPQLATLTLVKAGTVGKIALRVTEPGATTAAQVCLDCAAKAYTYPVGTKIQLVAIDAAKSGRWSSTNNFCVQNGSDPTDCIGTLGTTPLTATATFNDCGAASSGTANLAVGTPIQCGQVTIKKTLNGGAQGVVTGTGTGGFKLTCGPLCVSSTTGVAIDGRMVTFTATPKAGYAVTAWTGGCATSTLGNPASCTVPLNVPRTMGVTMSGSNVDPNPPPAGLLDVSWSKAGTGASLGTVTATVDGMPITSGNDIPAGKSVVFTAGIPSTGAFISWSGPCTPSGNTCTTAPLSGPVSVGARFEKYLTYTVSSAIKSGSTGGGSLWVKYPKGYPQAQVTESCVAPCTLTVKTLAGMGTNVNVIAGPDGASIIDAWNGLCQNVNKTTMTCGIPAVTDGSVGVVYTSPSYSVTVNVRGYILGTDLRLIGALGDAPHNGLHSQQKDCQVKYSCVGWTWDGVHKGQNVLIAYSGGGYGVSATYTGCDSTRPTSGSCTTIESNRTITLFVNGDGGLLTQADDSPRSMLARVTAAILAWMEPVRQTIARAISGARGLLAAIGAVTTGPDLTPYSLFQTPLGAGVGTPVSFAGSVGNVGGTAFTGSYNNALVVEQRVNGLWVQRFTAATTSASLVARQLEFPRWSNTWTPAAAGEYRMRFCLTNIVGTDADMTNNCSFYTRFTVGTAYVPPPPPVFNVTVAPRGGGVITSTSNTADANFTGCGVISCSRDFRDGSTVVLSAAPNVGKKFVRWGGLSGSQCVIPTGSPNKCQITVDAYKAVIAVFESTTTETLTLCGDADRSGAVTSADSLAVEKYAVGTLVNINTKNADANGDGKVTLTDSTLILKAATGTAKLTAVSGACQATLL